MSCCTSCFVKQKTAYEMLISDWISDVCSSDLRRRRRHSPALSELESGGDVERSYAGDDGMKKLDRGCYTLVERIWIAFFIIVSARNGLSVPGTGKFSRSETRRVGKECVRQCRSRGARHKCKKKIKHIYT